MNELQKLEPEWKVHWMLMQELGMSDVEIGHIQMLVVSLNRGECCWHLEWETKGEADQNERIYIHQADGHSQADPSSHQGCPPKQEPFHAKFRPLMGSKSMEQLRKGICRVSQRHVQPIPR